MEDARSSAVEGYEEAIEEIDDLGSILGDAERSSARRELGEHARSFAQEIEVLLGKQLAVIEQEEMRALRFVARLQERARSLAEREQAVSEQQERLRASQAELEERRLRLDELRSQLTSLEERIAHEENLKAERAGETERLDERGRLLAMRERDLRGEQERLRQSEAELEERGRLLAVRERDLGEEQERLRESEAELEERGRRLDELRSELALIEERIAHEEKLKVERASESERQRARADELLAGARTLAEQLADLGRLRAELGAGTSALAEREAVIAQREGELERRAKGVAARELLVRRVERPAPAPPGAPGRTFNIDELERLVAARRNEFPDEVPEWEAYLFQLRPQSTPDGLLPERLTGLIEDVFAPLL